MSIPRAISDEIHFEQAYDLDIKMTRWLDGDISTAEAFGYSPKARCAAKNRRGRPCSGDMTYRQDERYCADHQSSE